MTTIIKAAKASDFLALVPRLLTYSPVRSLVLVPFGAHRTLGAMRLDLPDVVDPAEIDRLASTYIGMVCKVADADAVAPVVYTDTAFSESGGPPHATLMSALLSRADLCGLRVVDALCVAPDGWGSYLDPLCPAEGRPLAELAFDHPRLDELPASEGDQETGAELPEVDLAEKERLARALRSLEQALALLLDDDAPDTPRDADARRIDPRALAAACGLDDVPMLFEEALGWDDDRLDPFDAAALTWCLARPAMRDVALMQWCGDLADGDEAFDAQLRWRDDGERYPEHLARPMWGEGPRPDPDRLLGALALTRRLAASAPRSTQPGILAACAWLAWALGRSTHAAAYARSALSIEPGHGLSEIVLTFVGNAHLPEWTYDRTPR